MGGRGFRHGTEGDVLVEGNQAAVVFDRKGEQVEVGEMFGAKDSNMIEMARVADAQYVCPKGMIGMFDKRDESRGHFCYVETHGLAVGR